MQVPANDRTYLNLTPSAFLTCSRARHLPQLVSNVTPLNSDRRGGCSFFRRRLYVWRLGGARTQPTTQHHTKKYRHHSTQQQQHTPTFTGHDEGKLSSGRTRITTTNARTHSPLLLRGCSVRCTLVRAAVFNSSSISTTTTTTTGGSTTSPSGRGSGVAAWRGALPPRSCAAPFLVVLVWHTSAAAASSSPISARVGGCWVVLRRGCRGLLSGDRPRAPVL